MSRSTCEPVVSTPMQASKQQHRCKPSVCTRTGALSSTLHSLHSSNSPRRRRLIAPVFPLFYTSLVVLPFIFLPSKPPTTASVFPPTSMFFFFLLIRRPPRSPLFPSTPLFR